MKVFVTGGTGFVGTHVVAALRERGHEVRALVRPTSRTAGLERAGAETFAGSLEDEASLAEGLRGSDAVLHIAGLIKARTEAEMMAVNGVATERLANAAARACPDLRRFVYVSSIAAAGPGDPEGGPLTEDLPARPVSVYGRSKRDGEARLLPLASSLPLTIVRPPIVYGPHDREVLTFFQMARRGVMPLLFGGRNRASVIYVEDLALALALAIERDHPSGSVFFVEDGEPSDWRSRGSVIGEAVGRSPRFVALPLWAVAGAARVSKGWETVSGRVVMLSPDKLEEMRQLNWTCSSARIREALDWAPRVPFPDGTRRTAEWYRREGWLS